MIHLSPELFGRPMQNEEGTTGVLVGFSENQATLGNAPQLYLLIMTPNGSISVRDARFWCFIDPVAVAECVLNPMRTVKL